MSIIYINFYVIMSILLPLSHLSSKLPKNPKRPKRTSIKRKSRIRKKSQNSTLVTFKGGAERRTPGSLRAPWSAALGAAILLITTRTYPVLV